MKGPAQRQAAEYNLTSVCINPLHAQVPGCDDARLLLHGHFQKGLEACSTVERLSGTRDSVSTQASPASVPWVDTGAYGSPRGGDVALCCLHQVPEVARTSKLQNSSAGSPPAEAWGKGTFDWGLAD